MTSNGSQLPPQQAIAADGLHLSFDGRTQVLDNIALQVADGEFVSLVGPSGCGKTSLLNLCAGLGSSRVGYMLARDSLLPWCTALENAAFGARVRGVGTADSTERALRMLQEVGLADHAQALPKALSHGMRPRTALARTFAVEAELLLMDEPFGALDEQTKLQLQDLLPPQRGVRDPRPGRGRGRLRPRGGDVLAPGPHHRRPAHRPAAPALHPRPAEVAALP